MEGWGIYCFRRGISFGLDGWIFFYCYRELKEKIGIDSVFKDLVVKLRSFVESKGGDREVWNNFYEERKDKFIKGRLFGSIEGFFEIGYSDFLGVFMNRVRWIF